LTALVSFVENHPEVAGVAPHLIAPDRKPQGNVRKRLGLQALLLHRVLFLRWTGLFRSANRQYRQVDFDLKQSAYVAHLVGAALAMPHRQFDWVGGWDETFEFGTTISIWLSVSVNPARGDSLGRNGHGIGSTVWVSL